MYKVIVWAALAAIAACGGGPAPAQAPENAREEPAQPRPAFRVKSELGTVDPAAVERAFHALEDKFTECQKRGLDRIEVLAGSLKVFVRIGENGGPKWAYLEESELGDRATEKCVVEAVLGGHFPRPDGGEAEARYSMELALQSTRPPTEWEPGKLAKSLAKHSGELDRCKAREGAPVRATVYVGPGGKVLAAGVAAASKDGEEQADCIAAVLEKMKGVPSPGSWPAKVSVSF